MGRSSPKRVELKKTLSQLEKTRPGAKAKIAALKKEISLADEGRGSPTRGWRAASPQRGKERHKLKEQCGNKCFLKPSQEGYPVCPALSRAASPKKKCETDCRGVLAALIRAAQQGDTQTANKARTLYNKKCSPRKAVSPNRSPRKAISPKRSPRKAVSPRKVLTKRK